VVGIPDEVVGLFKHRQGIGAALMFPSEVDSAKPVNIR
jgi:hypothetical protein